MEGMGDKDGKLWLVMGMITNMDISKKFWRVHHSYEKLGPFFILFRASPKFIYKPEQPTSY